MNHDSICDEDLIAYAMGEQCNGSTERIAAHIVACADCAATVQRLVTIRQVCITDDSIAPPPETRVRAYGMFRRTLRLINEEWMAAQCAVGSAA